MQYNTQRSQLQFPDYGRNVYHLIQLAKRIQNRDERTRAAYAIVNVMAQVSPNAKEGADYKHRLWDHLMMWSNFELDVDTPYPVTQTKTMQFQPHRLKYKDNSIRYRHYGKCLENMIKKAVTLPEGAEKRELTLMLANLMKKSYIEWNQNPVSDEVILQQLHELSEGKLSLSEKDRLTDVRAPQPMYHSNARQPMQKKKKKHLIK